MNRQQICIGLILGTGLAAIFFLISLHHLTTASQAAEIVTLPPARHIAIIGEKTQIVSTTQPFIQAGVLQFLRHYPQPHAYLAEAPAGVYTGTLTVTLFLYEVTVTPPQIPLVIAQIDSAASAVSLTAVYEDLAWLSYMPGHLIATGSCAHLDEMFAAAPGATPIITEVTEMDRIDLVFTGTLSGCPASRTQMRLYTLQGTSTVSDKVALVNSLVVTRDVYAEPNYFTLAAGEDYIAGSPGGPQLRYGRPLTLTPVFTATGDEIRVVIFDTLPYTLGLDPPTVITTVVAIDSVPVTVWAPYKLATILPEDGLYVPAHGTFVASPVTQAAPDADIHLIRILNDFGLGDMWLWFKAMEMMVSHTLAVSDSLEGVVFNYSFVLEAPDDSSQQAAMHRMLTAVDGLHIVQVAAAGNESAYTYVPQPMRQPAAHAAVIGVTAVTHDNQIACYANRGEIAAPGGGIRRGLPTCDTVKIVRQCANGAHPEACVTGWNPLPLPPPPPLPTPPPPTLYDWGLGTSFATPMISGLAAQCLEWMATGTNHSWCNRVSKATAAYPAMLAGPPPAWPGTDALRAQLYGMALPGCDANVGAGIVMGLDTAINCPVYVPFVANR